MSIAERLKRETAAAHRCTEGIVNIEVRVASVASYHALLARFYGFYAVWEPQLATVLGAEVFDAKRRKIRTIGFPKTIRVDNGPEFVSRDLDLWAYQREVTLHFSRPGKPTDNAFVESFNGKFRAECLNAHWFMGLDDARRKCEAWRRDDNEERPHSAIGHKCPAELMIGSAEIDPR